MSQEPTHPDILPEQTTMTYGQPLETWATKAVLVDSSALYEAVNAYVDKLSADRWNVAAIEVAYERVMAAAYALADVRYEQRRAGERERLKYADEGSGT